MNDDLFDAGDRAHRVSLPLTVRELNRLDRIAARWNASAQSRQYDRADVLRSLLAQADGNGALPAAGEKPADPDRASRDETPRSRPPQTAPAAPAILHADNGWHRAAQIPVRDRRRGIVRHYDISWRTQFLDCCGRVATVADGLALPLPTEQDYARPRVGRVVRCDRCGTRHQARFTARLVHSPADHAPRPAARRYTAGAEPRCTEERP